MTRRRLTTRRMRLIALAGATVLMIQGCAGGDVEAISASDPAGIARAFIDARDARDIDAALALLADDVVISDIDDSPSAMRARFDSFEATDHRWYVEECTVQEPGPPSQVVCTYTHENAWSRALAVGPFDGGSFTFMIEDGLIQSLSHFFDTAEFSPQVWEVFADWVAENHPDVVVYQMYARYEVQKPGLDRWSGVTDKPFINGDSSFTMIGQFILLVIGFLVFISIRWCISILDIDV